MSGTAPSLIALVPAHNEADRVAATVEALLELVSRVIVVDDGSTDGTGEAAAAAGAEVLRRSRRLGKGEAVEAALGLAPAPEVWLLADADLGASAAGLSALTDAVSGGRADLAIAIFPPAGGGGFGAVKRFAAMAIRRLSGFRAREPLSGQRAITAACLDAARPLARGFGMETAMTIDAARAGYRVIEIEVPQLAHRPRGRGPRGFAHRGRQGWQIALAAARRLPGR
jgi:glycosyltransferase involved in cell wall biosynthesis